MTWVIFSDPAAEIDPLLGRLNAWFLATVLWHAPCNRQIRPFLTKNGKGRTKAAKTYLERIARGELTLIGDPLVESDGSILRMRCIPS